MLSATIWRSMKPSTTNHPSKSASAAKEIPLTALTDHLKRRLNLLAVDRTEVFGCRSAEFFGFIGNAMEISRVLYEHLLQGLQRAVNGHMRILQGTTGGFIEGGFQFIYERFDTRCRITQKSLGDLPIHPICKAMNLRRINRKTAW